MKASERPERFRLRRMEFSDLAPQHDAIGRQRGVTGLQGVGVEGGDHRIEPLDDAAHRRAADRPTQKRRQRLVELARRLTEHEAR